jgi:hypothetical protein
MVCEWDSVTHQMAVPIPSISCCVLNHHNLFYQIQNVLAFKWDMCCHLALCLQLLPLYYKYHSRCLTWHIKHLLQREMCFECFPPKLQKTAKSDYFCQMCEYTLGHNNNSSFNIGPEWYLDGRPSKKFQVLIVPPKVVWVKPVWLSFFACDSTSPKKYLIFFVTYEWAQ